MKCEYEMWQDEINRVKTPWVKRLREPLIYVGTVLAAGALYFALHH